MVPNQETGTWFGKDGLIWYNGRSPYLQTDKNRIIFQKLTHTRGYMKKNKKPCGPISSEEERIALLGGFHKQNTYTTVAEYAKANNVNANTFFGWSVRYGIPLGFHHSNYRKAFSEEQRLALLKGFQKQNTYTTVAKYAKANNVSKSNLRDWSVRYGIPLGFHHSNYRKAFSEEQKLALLKGFQKQNTYTTIESYEKANNVRKGSLSRWSRRYGVSLGDHHTKVLPKEQKIALLEGFHKQNTYTTIESYTKANNVNRRLFQFWSALYGIPLGNHHTKVLPKEQKLDLLEGFHKQNIYATVAEYAKANNVSKGALARWAVHYGIPLGNHHGNNRNQLREEQKIALLEGFHKQNTHATSTEYAKANNVSKGALCIWSRRYGIPLGWHHIKALPEEQKLALLEGFQKQNTYTTIGSYEKANNVNKGALGRWSRRYGIPLGWHHTKRIQKTPHGRN